jgi:hypothetical protein
MILVFAHSEGRSQIIIDEITIKCALAVKTVRITCIAG